MPCSRRGKAGPREEASCEVASGIVRGEVCRREARHGGLEVVAEFCWDLVFACPLARPSWRLSGVVSGPPLLVLFGAEVEKAPRVASGSPLTLPSWVPFEALLVLPSAVLVADLVTCPWETLPAALSTLIVAVQAAPVHEVELVPVSGSASLEMAELQIQVSRC